MNKLTISNLVKAVVIKGGVIQCITTSKQAINRALQASAQQGHPEAEVKDVIVVDAKEQPTKISWDVVGEDSQLVRTCATRESARSLKKSFGGKIVRKEYLCVSSEVVS